jgi:type III secretion protein J
MLVAAAETGGGAQARLRFGGSRQRRDAGWTPRARELAPLVRSTAPSVSQSFHSARACVCFAAGACLRRPRFGDKHGSSLMIPVCGARLTHPLGRFAGLARLLSLGAVLGGCTVPVAGNLDDREANRVFVALDRANVDATKEADPAMEGKWRIEVARDDVPRALSALREEQLPRREPASVLDALTKGSLVPSEATEHAALVAGMAGDLERSLEGVEGVLRARVHLNVPGPSARLDGPVPRGSASVLLEHRGATPPLSADAVARLVAGGVAGLLPTDVTVVMLVRDLASAPGPSELGHVGPIAVARTSMRGLQAALVALAGVVAVLAASTLVLYSRWTRARADLAREIARDAATVR